MLGGSQEELSLRDAAAQAGVHYQTAYRWVREGRLAAAKVDGSYRVSPSALAELLDVRAAPAPPSPPSSERVERQCERMLEALLDGDESHARKIGRTLVDEGLSVLELIEKVIAPPLRAIGARWADGGLSISVEHRASAIVERLLADVTPNPRGRRRGTLAVMAVEGERHGLPTVMASVALRERNWVVHHLGADLPLTAIDEFCESHALDAVVVSSTTPEMAHRLDDTVEHLTSRGISVVVGSPGASLSDLAGMLEGSAVRTNGG